MYELSLFSGVGGGILAGKILGWRTIGAVEIEKYPIGVLLARQNDHSLSPFPVWTNVRSFTKRNNECRSFIRQLQRIRDSLVISGGFPCQDISVAGKGAGIDGKRSGLWKEYFRIVKEIRPALVYVENSPILTQRGLHILLNDFAKVGYDATWGVLGASDVGANHIRKRIWILAYSEEIGPSGRQTYGNDRNRPFCARKQGPHEAVRCCPVGCGENVANANSSNGWRHNIYNSISRKAKEIKGKEQRENRDRLRSGFGNSCENVAHSNLRSAKCEIQAGWTIIANSRISSAVSNSLRKGLPNARQKPDRKDGLESWRTIAANSWWQTEPDVGRVVDGLADRVERLKALGNGQVPLCAAAAFELLNYIRLTM